MVQGVSESESHMGLGISVVQKSKEWSTKDHLILDMEHKEPNRGGVLSKKVKMNLFDDKNSSKHFYGSENNSIFQNETADFLKFCLKLFITKLF